MDTSLVGGTTEQCLQLAAKRVDNMTQKWRVLSSEGETKIPKFDISEIALGRILGQGAFCYVNEVNAVMLKEEVPMESGIESRGFIFDVDGKAKKNAMKKKPKDYIEQDPHENINTSRRGIIQNRDFISSRCIRNGDARYAIKRLKEDILLDHDISVKGVVDLVLEMRILANVYHPNIIKMRGVASGNPYKKNHFLVLDRLYDTLSDRLIQWKKEESRFLVGKKKKEKMLKERITFAFDLASAIRFLHEHSVIYRDLKPDNIGFDVRGDIKLFDFGLAKEIPNEHEDAVYKLSGLTGSLRYMAPEVAQHLPYNLKADVFSFGILLWQMVSLEVPFDGYNVALHRKLVIDGNTRPTINEKWSDDLKYAMENSWLEEISHRLPIFELYNALLPLVSSFDDFGDDTFGMNASEKSVNGMR